MDSKIPRVAIGSAIAMYGGPAVLLIVITLMRRVPLWFALVDVFWLSLFVSFIPSISTKFSPEGISQIRLGGRRLYRWCDVSEVKKNGLISRGSTTPTGLKLKVNGETVRVALVFFPKASEAYEYAEKYLKQTTARWHT